VGVLAILVGAAVVLNHRGAEQPVLTTKGIASAPAHSTPSAPPAATPAPGPVVDSAAGSIAPLALSDSAVFASIRDSIVEADAEKRAARRERQAADEAAARERDARVVTDSNGVTWTTVRPPPLDSVQRAVNASRVDSVKRDTTRVPKKDTIKTKPDTVVKPDTGTVRIR
jgi:hypothetical protein